jgi:zinc finger protein
LTEPKSSEDTGKQHFITKTTCPLCKKELTIRWDEDNIPYLGDVMYISSLCDCGFRFADTLILSQKEPTRYELHVRSSDELNTRVVRSTSGTLRLPELGITIEPGPASESFISNVEGVLQRARSVLLMLAREEENRKRACELLQQIDEICKHGGVTLILEDPTGNSAILSEYARKTVLTPEEASRLKMGAVEFGIAEDRD